MFLALPKRGEECSDEVLTNALTIVGVQGLGLHSMAFGGVSLLLAIFYSSIASEHGIISSWDSVPLGSLGPNHSERLSADF